MTTAEVPRTGRVADAVLTLLDRQVVDPHGGLVCNVDDLELTVPEDGGPPYVSAILVGPAALGPRVGGLPGRLMVFVQRLLHPSEDPAPARIDFGVVVGVDDSVHVAVDRDETEANRFEAWVRDHVVARIPGASHDAGG